MTAELILQKIQKRKAIHEKDYDDFLEIENVTADKYELPLAVEDTQEKLARRLGITKGTVGKIVYMSKRGRYGVCRAKYRIYEV